MKTKNMDQLLEEFGAFKKENKHEFILLESDSEVELAIKFGSIDILKFIHEESFEMYDTTRLNMQDAENGNTPTHAAALYGHLEIMQWLDTEENVPFDNEPNNQGKTPMHLAVEGGHLEIMKWLHEEKNIPLDTQDGEGRTLMHLATLKENLDIMKWLKEKNASLETKDGAGRTPMNLATLKENLDIMKWLEEKNASLETKDGEGRTPIHVAVQLSNLEMMKWLGEKNVSLETQDKYGKTLMHLAVQHSNLEIVKWLGEKNVSLETRNINKRTPIHVAALNKELKTFEYLIEKGASTEGLGDYLLTAEMEDIKTIAEYIRVISSKYITISGDYIPLAKNIMSNYLINNGIPKDYELYLKNSLCHQELVDHYKLIEETNTQLQILEGQLLYIVEDLTPTPYKLMIQYIKGYEELSKQIKELMLQDKRTSDQDKELKVKKQELSVKEEKLSPVEQKLIKFYKEHPEYQTPGKYLYDMAKCDSEIAGLTVLNKAMLSNEEFFVFSNLFKSEYASTSIKEVLAKSIVYHNDNYDKYDIGDTALSGDYSGKADDL